MNFLTSIQNLIQYINENWTTIIIIIGLSISLGKKINDYLNKTNEEKVEIAKQQLKEIMLKLVTDAEESYYEWVNAGSLKRSQVIDKVFTKYPALAKVTNQEEIIAWIDETIDNALKVMRDVFEKQAEKDDFVSEEADSE